MLAAFKIHVVFSMKFVSYKGTRGESIKLLNIIFVSRYLLKAFEDAIKWIGGRASYQLSQGNGKEKILFVEESAFQPLVVRNQSSYNLFYLLGSSFLKNLFLSHQYAIVASVIVLKRENMAKTSKGKNINKKYVKFLQRNY